MTNKSIDKGQVLSLYRSLLRVASSFSTYGCGLTYRTDINRAHLAVDIENMHSGGLGTAFDRIARYLVRATLQYHTTRESHNFGSCNDRRLLIICLN